MNNKITISLAVLMAQWHAMHFYTMLAFVDMLFVEMLSVHVHSEDVLPGNGKC